MLGKTHITLGLMTSLLVLPILGNFLIIDEINTTAILVALVGAILPDLDMGTSSLGTKFGIIKKVHIKKIWTLILTLLSIITIVFLKDTPIFYGIAIIIFFCFVYRDRFATKSYYVIRNFIQGLVGVSIILGALYYGHYVLIGLGGILIVLLFSKHRGLSHSISFLIVCTYIVRKISLFYGQIDYSIIFGISMSTHLIGDMLTRAGVSLFSPLTNKRIKFPFNIKTNGKIERIIFLISLFMIFKLLL